MMLVTSNYCRITVGDLFKQKGGKKEGKEKEILPSLLEVSPNIQASIFVSADSMDVAGRVII